MVAGRAAARTGVAPARKVRVAVVDDHPVVRAGLVAILDTSRTCALVAQASTAAQALAVLPEATPDVVLLDLKLPDRGGTALVGDLAQVLPAAKVLVLTAYEEPGLAREALSQGARGYLLKGAPAEDLLAAIGRVACGDWVVDGALAGTLWEPPVKPSRPSRRELQILRLLAQGRSNKEIATALCISCNTVKFHLRKVYARLEARTRTEAVVEATRLGHLTVPN